MLSFGSRCLACLLLAGLVWQPGSARADDLGDCKSPVPERAEPACSAIINDARRAPDDRLTAYANRSRIYAFRAKADLALADAESAMKLNPGSVAALLARASARQRMGSLDLALADLTQAIERDSTNPAIFTARGIIRNEQKAWAAAQADFTRAITLRQDFASAYVGRARSYLETAELDRALTDLNTVIAFNPSVPGGFFWRGQVYRRKGDTEKAIEDFTRAITQAPQTEVGSYLLRAQLYSARGDYGHAIADYDRLLAMAPGNQEIQRQRQLAVGMQADMAKVRGNPTAAGAPLSSMAAMPPQAPAQTAGASGPSIQQAKQLFDQKRYADAIAQLNQVLSGDPRNDAALRLRAACLLRLSRPAEARADLDELIRLKPNDVSLL